MENCRQQFVSVELNAEKTNGWHPIPHISRTRFDLAIRPLYNNENSVNYLCFPIRHPPSAFTIHSHPVFVLQTCRIYFIISFRLNINCWRFHSTLKGRVQEECIYIYIYLNVPQLRRIPQYHIIRKFPQSKQ